MKLLCGDCLEVMKDIPDKSIDMILCDLPYGITACKWDVVIPFEPLWVQYKRIIRDYGVIVLFGSGSIGIACMNTKREFIGIEKDVEYFTIAKNRIEKHIPPD